MTKSSSLVALVTGASAGFGLSLCKSFLAHGYNVLAASRSITSPSMLELKALGAALLELDPNAPPETIKDIITKHAIPVYGKIDIVVNNAGYLLEGATEEVFPEDLEAIYRTNVFGPIYISNAVLPSMRARRSGLILNISSVGAHATIAGGGIYSSTKSAISMITLGQRAELAPLNIEVATVEPGYFRTSLLAKTSPPKGRIVDYDIALNREFLSSANGQQQGDPDKGSNALVEEIVGRWVRGGFKAGSLETARIPLGSDALIWSKSGAMGVISDYQVWENSAVMKTDF